MVKVKLKDTSQAQKEHLFYIDCAFNRKRERFTDFVISRISKPC